MKQRKTPKTTKSFKGALGLLREFPSERECHDFFASMRWPKEVECPHCHVTGRAKKFKTRLLYFCGACRTQFTVRIGTIFENSPLSLQKWFYAVYMLTAHKKGISSHQLGRDIGVTQKTAWHMLHRIRFALDRKLTKPLDGIVEVDEAYFGGKEKFKHHSKKQYQGHGYVGKAPVIGMLDRDDKTVLTIPVDKVNAKTIEDMLKKHVHKDSTIMTDESRLYAGVVPIVKDRKSVDHSHSEYVRGDVHTNTLDGFWSILKRGIIGVYHQISVKHLHRYCDEFEYRYNNRKLTDRERFEQAMGHFKGRLKYRTLTAK